MKVQLLKVAALALVQALFATAHEDAAVAENAIDDVLADAAYAAVDAAEGRTTRSDCFRMCDDDFRRRSDNDRCRDACRRRFDDRRPTPNRRPNRAPNRRPNRAPNRRPNWSPNRRPNRSPTRRSDCLRMCDRDFPRRQENDICRNACRDRDDEDDFGASTDTQMTKKAVPKGASEDEKTKEERKQARAERKASRKKRSAERKASRKKRSAERKASRKKRSVEKKERKAREAAHKKKSKENAPPKPPVAVE